MNPQVTPATSPIHVQIADFIRIRIEIGELSPGSPIPTLNEIKDEWSCSIASARTAIQLLKAQGLISGGRGKPPTVRVPPTRVVRSSERHQVEKDLVMASESERKRVGQAELDMSVKIDDMAFRASYSDTTVGAQGLQAWFCTKPETPLVARVYELREPKTDTLRMWSVSYLLRSLIVGNSKLLDESNEPWPGGTQHQLYTVGIEVLRIVDEVSARMPSTVEAADWDLDSGIPLLRVRRISFDTQDRVIEVTDADFPADRTELRFNTNLFPWE